jgi:hypothetical protein
MLIFGLVHSNLLFLCKQHKHLTEIDEKQSCPRLNSDATRYVIKTCDNNIPIYIFFKFFFQHHNQLTAIDEICDHIYAHRVMLANL